MIKMQKSSKADKFGVAVILAAALYFIFSGGPDGGTAGPAGPSPDISRATFQGDWPFTVDHGQVRCDEGVYMVFESGGITYALTGLSASREFKIMGEGKMYEPLEKIWKPHPNPDFAKAGVKVNTGDVTKHAEKFCP